MASQDQWTEKSALSFLKKRTTTIDVLAMEMAKCGMTLVFPSKHIPMSTSPVPPLTQYEFTDKRGKVFILTIPEIAKVMANSKE